MNSKYKIRKILDSKIINNKLHYLVDWEDSWVKEKDMLCVQLLQQFKDKKNFEVHKKLNLIHDSSSDGNKGENETHFMNKSDRKTFKTAETKKKTLKKSKEDSSKDKPSKYKYRKKRVWSPNQDMYEYLAYQSPQSESSQFNESSDTSISRKRLPRLQDLITSDISDTELKKE